MEEHQDRYNILCRLPAVANWYVETGDLILLGIAEDVIRLVNGVEWNKFVEIKESTVRELSLEFLATFHFHKISRIDYDREDTIIFRLRVLHLMSISEFGVKYGFYDEEFLETVRYQISIF